MYPELTPDTYKEYVSKQVVVESDLQTERDSNEALRQKVHEQKLALDLLKFTEVALNEELLTAQKSKNDLDEQIRDLRKTIQHSERNQVFDESLTQEDISFAEPSVPPVVDDSEQCSELRQQLDSLSATNTKLLIKLSTVESNITELEEENKQQNASIISLHLKIAELNAENKQLLQRNEFLENKSTDQADQIEALTASLTETKRELLRVTEDLTNACAPNLASRGNSMFSELEDNRLKMVQKYNELKVGYQALKKKTVSQQYELSKLANDKVAVSRMLEDFVNEAETASHCTIRALQVRVRELEDTNKSLIAESKDSVKVLTDSDSLLYIQTLLDQNKKDNDLLKQKVEERSKSVCFMQETLNDMQSKLHRKIAENVRLTSELEYLKKASLQDP